MVKELYMDQCRNKLRHIHQLAELVVSKNDNDATVFQLEKRGGAVNRSTVTKLSNCTLCIHQSKLASNTYHVYYDC